MSIFGRIMSAIFGQSANAAPPPGGTSGGAAPPVAGATTAPTTAGASPSATATGQQVDVGAVLNKLAQENKEKLDWQHSIVDLMKLLNIDSSLAARKELAQELQYDGDTGDSASMNIWLHKQVIAKLAQNGGKLPAELQH